MSNWKETLAAVAPTLASALVGPLAGSVVSVIGNKLLGVEDATESQIADAIKKASPEQLVALQEINNQYEIDMKSLDVKNTEGARKMAIDTSILPQVTLSIVYTVGYFWLMSALISGDVTIPEDINGMVMALLGVMTAAQAQIMNFWFGSSSGSKEKTNKLAG